MKLSNASIITIEKLRWKIQSLRGTRSNAISRFQTGSPVKGRRAIWPSHSVGFRSGRLVRLQMALLPVAGRSTTKDFSMNEPLIPMCAVINSSLFLSFNHPFECKVRNGKSSEDRLKSFQWVAFLILLWWMESIEWTLSWSNPPWPLCLHRCKFW